MSTTALHTGIILAHDAGNEAEDKLKDEFVAPMRTLGFHNVFATASSRAE